MEAWARRTFEPLLVPVVAAVARSGVSPNALTVLGAALNGVAGMLVGLGLPFWGGLLMVVLAMPLDALDGGVARLRGLQTRFGAFLDSTLDRLAEGALLGGVAVWFAQRGEVLGVAGAVAALIGSFMVSYTRARAEGLGLACKVGLFSRFGRFLLLAAGLLGSAITAHSLAIMVWLMTLLTAYTTLERIAHVWRVTRDPNA
ncbi:MAG: CDP-alcohol phosphatidyltransferase family protein [Thermoflexales bacterium]|nr:CDP-alcohol phosphatidyltransferase family protein [Thermoflexales bacterium]